MKVRINHDYGGFIIIQRPNEYRHSSLTRQLAPSLAPVACNDLVAALFTGTDDTGRQNTAPRDTLHRFLHRFGSKLRIFDSIIPLSIRAAETSAEGRSIYLHDPAGKVSAAYTALFSLSEG